MNKTPFLILVSGLPASGKTTLASKIAQQFNLPLIAKDELKELFSDTLEVTDPESSKRFGILARVLQPYLAEKFLNTGQSIILEANFNQEFDEPRLKRVIEKTKASVIQILCQAPNEMLFERFKNRVEKGDRHKIHAEHYVDINQFKPVFSKGHAPALALGGRVLEIDTSDFNKIDLKKVFDFINS